CLSICPRGPPCKAHGFPSVGFQHFLLLGREKTHDGTPRPTCGRCSLFEYVPDRFHRNFLERLHDRVRPAFTQRFFAVLAPKRTPMHFMPAASSRTRQASCLSPTYPPRLERRADWVCRTQYPPPIR